MVSIDDLAPGDRAGSRIDPNGFNIRRIRSTEDPFFAIAYSELCREFGEGQAMESIDVLSRRFGANSEGTSDGYTMLYEMALWECDGAFAAAVDYSAIVHDGHAVVHLSHILAAPAWRGTGLAAWLRAMPLALSRECLAKAGHSGSGAVTIVAEMSHPNAGSLPALRSFEKAGFLKVDPSVAPYHQPDFRSPSEIDESGVIRPLPFALVLRRVGREDEQEISGRQLREIVEALYAMYGRGFSPKVMATCREFLKRFPGDRDRVRLLPPTAI